MFTISLTEEQRALLSRPVGLPLERCGGFQRLIYRLQEGLRLRPEGWSCQMTYDDGRAVLRYSKKSYGSGTYQTQLRAIAPAVERALKDAGGDEPPALF